MPTERLVVAAPLRLEAMAVRRGLPGVPVIRVGMGPARAARAVPRLRAMNPTALAVAGVAGALTDTLAPGDVVVATEIRGTTGTVPCPTAAMLASALRRIGLTVHTGPIVTTGHVVHGPERVALVADGALAVDMESAALAPAARGCVLAVVRAIVDTPGRPLLHPATVPGGITAFRSLARIGPALRSWASDESKEVRQ